MITDTNEANSVDSARQWTQKQSHLTGGYKPPKPELRPGSPVCECSQCGEFFSTPTVFDRHQTVLNSRRGDVHCRTEAEMLSIGMVKNENGVWLKGVSEKKAKGE